MNKKQFKASVWDLLFDLKFKKFKGNFTTHWLGPYEVDMVFDNGSVNIKTIDGSCISFMVNDHRLKLYHKLSS
jgi:hypothetical protein